MTDSNFQIIAVDNDSRELDKIRKAFDLLKTPCLPILYNEGDNIDEKYSNIRIAFFDINLGGLGNPADPLLCNIIASALKEILDKNNGPYALIFWSLHISKLPIIKKYIEEREKDDIPSPLVIDTINKALINNVDELKAEIQRVLANSTLNAMLDYEKKAHDAASKTINSLFSLIPRGNDKWGENIIFENNFDLIFSKMAANTMGIKLARKTPVIAIQRTLFPILQHNIKKADLSSVWINKLSSVNQDAKLKFPSDFKTEALNTIYHIDNDKSHLKKDERGVVIKVKKTSTLFKNIFGKKKNELIKEYFSFPSIKGKKEEEVESIRLQYIEKCIPVFVEISASCDYAQQNPRALKYLFGIKYPIDPTIAKPSSGEYKFFTPSFLLNDEKFAIILNFRYIYGFQITNAILDEIIFKLSDNLINQIGNRYANYASRIGIISHE